MKQFVVAAVQSIATPGDVVKSVADHVRLAACSSRQGVTLSKHTFVGDKGDYYEIVDGAPQSDSY